jgi:hypothetical protein
LTRRRNEGRQDDTTTAAEAGLRREVLLVDANIDFIDPIRLRTFLT